MKKIIAMLLMVVMTACLFTACTEPVVKPDYIVGVLHIGDPADGSGYSFAHDEGIKAMVENMKKEGKNVKVVRKNNIADTNAAATRTAIEGLIEEGCQLIFGTSWGYMDTLETFANDAKYANVLFSHGSGYKSNSTNFNNYFGRIYQARYLSGIVAGLQTTTNKIGYVAAQDITNSEVTGGIDAFALGVESVNPQAKVYVKVLNSWFDPANETAYAENLLDYGCDVIAQHCDTQNPVAAAKKAGKFAVGYNSDMTKGNETAHLTAPIWNWGVYYTEAVKQATAGTWKTFGNYFGGLKEGFVDISPINTTICKNTKTSEIVEAVKKMIVDGAFKVLEGKKLVINPTTGVIETVSAALTGKAATDTTAVDKLAADAVMADATITGDLKWYYHTVNVL